MTPERWERFSERERSMIAFGLIAGVVFSLDRRDRFVEKHPDNAESYQEMMTAHIVATTRMVDEIAASMGIDTAGRGASGSLRKIIDRLRHADEGGDDPFDIAIMRRPEGEQ